MEHRPALAGRCGTRGAQDAERGSHGRTRPEPCVIDCLITRHPHLPSDRMGHRLNGSGRSLVIAAAGELYGLAVTASDLARDRHLRWSLPAHGLTASVTHCGTLGAVALSAGPHVGVDLQDERDRPAALRWLGSLLGLPGPARLRDFAECEALIKASHLTKDTFAGVRLPGWRPGWRPTNAPPYLVCSTTLGTDTHLALAGSRPAAVRWWWRPSPTAPAARSVDPTTLDQG
ncbi:hypothetical protein SSP531S_40340 [Streptomyces spongiicola]|uniref:4'-phosphopantetheinyl transferase N-terminal domain-containing protein n=1 Tax=Streptomyces spongiicola TaxID=1690221 RepID=A0A388T5S0_9ACTN|nr:hypothetical protein [Streptomyces spongiicola]GBQ02575.1 hypothetical protein SSP531S_40340 [Streptomyces spongiicola]